MSLIIKNLTLTIILIVICSKSYSHEKISHENPLKKNITSISLLGVTPVLGFSYERLFTQKFSMEIGVGFLSLGLGMKYYPWGMKTNKLLFHTGIGVAASEFHKKPMIDGEGFVSYIPLGISYLGKRSLIIGANVGPGTSYFNFQNILIHGNLNVGVRF